MKSFEKANEEATKAFHNEALDVRDRVLAAKLRVQSRLLLSLENPSLSSQPCRLYLEELHGVPSIVNDFKCGLFSRFKQEKRLELVLSISAINFVVFNFLKSFTKGPVNLYDWPILKSGDWTYSPLIPDDTICNKLQDANIAIPNLEPLFSYAVNGDGVITPAFAVRENETTCADRDIWSIRQVLPKTGTYDVENKRFYTPTSTFNSDECFLVLFDSSTRVMDAIMAIYDVEFNTLVPTTDGVALMSYEASASTEAKIAFYENENGKIKNTGTMGAKLYMNNALITVTNKYQVVAIEKSGHLFRVYGKDGKLIQEFELYGGERESCVCIAFNFITEELVFVSRVESWYFLSTYEPEIGTRRHNVRLSLFGKKESNLRLTTHCRGPMVLVSRKYALHIQ